MKNSNTSKEEAVVEIKNGEMVLLGMKVSVNVWTDSNGLVNLQYFAVNCLEARFTKGTKLMINGTECLVISTSKATSMAIGGCARYKVTAEIIAD